MALASFKPASASKASLASRTFETKAEAENWAKREESEMNKGAYVDRREAERTTLGQALTRYATKITPTKKSPKSELSTIRRWMAHPLALRPLAQLRSVDFSQYR